MSHYLLYNRTASNTFNCAFVGPLSLYFPSPTTPEPFEQESNSSRRSFGGIGLGLAISKHVIELHGGDIFVMSTPGKGSKFVVSLPVTEEEVAHAMAPEVEVAHAMAPEEEVAHAMALPEEIVHTHSKEFRYTPKSSASGRYRRQGSAASLPLPHTQLTGSCSYERRGSAGLPLRLQSKGSDSYEGSRSEDEKIIILSGKYFTISSNIYVFRIHVSVQI